MEAEDWIGRASIVRQEEAPSWLRQDGAVGAAPGLASSGVSVRLDRVRLMARYRDEESPPRAGGAGAGMGFREARTVRGSTARGKV